MKHKCIMYRANNGVLAQNTNARRLLHRLQNNVNVKKIKHLLEESF